MISDDPARDSSGEAFLRRWSRRKREASRAGSAEGAPSAVEPADTTVPSAAQPRLIDGRPPVAVPRVAEGKPDTSRSPIEGNGSPNDHIASNGAEDPALPSVESLHFDSDFTPFLGPRIEESIKRAALKRLFRDPRFNVMDGLDVYIDDYSKFETLSPEEARGLAHARSVFDVARTEAEGDGLAGAEVDGDGRPIGEPAISERIDPVAAAEPGDGVLPRQPIDRVASTATGESADVKPDTATTVPGADGSTA